MCLPVMLLYCMCSRTASVNEIGSCFPTSVHKLKCGQIEQRSVFYKRLQDKVILTFDHQILIT